MEYKKLYEKIMKVDSLIRYVIIIDSSGRLMHGGQREGVSDYLSPDQQRKSLRHTIDAWKLRNEVSGSIGDGKYAFAEYEKIKRITIPLNKEHLIYLTTEVEADHSTIIKKILSLKSEMMIPA